MEALEIEHGTSEEQPCSLRDPLSLFEAESSYVSLADLELSV